MELIENNFSKDLKKAFFLQERGIQPSAVQVFFIPSPDPLACRVLRNSNKFLLIVRQLFWIGWITSLAYMFLNFPVTLMLKGDFPTGEF